MPTKHLEELKMEICRESRSRGVLKDGVEKKRRRGGAKQEALFESAASSFVFQAPNFHHLDTSSGSLSALAEHPLIMNVSSMTRQIGLRSTTLARSVRASSSASSSFPPAQPHLHLPQNEVPRTTAPSGSPTLASSSSSSRVSSFPPDETMARRRRAESRLLSSSSPFPSPSFFLSQSRPPKQTSSSSGFFGFKVCVSN